MRNTRTIFMITNEVDVEALFTNCFENKMLNILAIGNWSQQEIYSYRAFPELKLVLRNVDQIERYFEPQLKDMGGYTINTVSDNIFPRSVIYKDGNGSYQLTGYLTPFINNFVKTLNATLHVCWDHAPEENDIANITLLSDLVSAGVVDIPMSMTNLGFTPSYRNHSHIVELSKWQIMLPVESQISRALLVIGGGAKLLNFSIFILMSVYALVIHNVRRFELGLAPSLMCLWVIFDPVLRAILSQTFSMPRSSSLRLRWILAVLLLGSFLCYNIYITNLETLLVHPPFEPPILSLQDMRKAGLKIMISEPEKGALTFVLGQRGYNANLDLYEMVSTSVYQTSRSLPNTSYAYFITQTLWPHIKMKFIRQEQAAFRLSKELVFIPLVHFALRLPSNSIYTEAINRYILNTQSSGLYNHWRTQSFYDLLAIGKTKQLPYKDASCSMHLRWEDLYYYWLIYIVNVNICVLAFAGELLVCSIGRWREGRGGLA
ncbi:hypothetical protein AWZ03_010521 [Drosophila navojoa]|uniref:Ionotropic glutamate receptor C-terminal domain-containing protein n=2 Tax=Drosophila navojoa TaxID=7232 RepID=A0A484B2E5_DRONA|nr:hypothetical protein AWZ03_010521 [Drosophila navojoa]